MKKIFYLLIFIISGCSISAGSYPYAEEYEFRISENDLIENIKIFKKNNQRFNIPDELGLKDGRRSSNDHWYHFYFINPRNGQIFKTWVRGDTKSTKFALVAVRSYRDFNSWKLINKDFKHKDNTLIIEKFEKMIISRINTNSFKEEY